jgi:prepilin-type N-terminal cleavage/methylation domain-containing protein
MGGELMVLRAEGGFTLFEVIMVIVILGVLGLGFGNYFLESSRSYAWISEQADLSPACRLALNRTLREISLLRDTSSLYTMTSKQMAFHSAAGDSIVLAWGGTPGGPLTMSRNGASYTLASNVDSLGFTYLDAVGTVTAVAANVRRVQVRLRLARGTHKVMNGSTVYVRNS